MNRFAKLFHYELIRIRKIYFSLFILIFVSQFAGLYLFTRRYMTQAHDIMVREFLTEGEYAEKYGFISFEQFCNSSFLFMAPIVLCVAAVLLYMFLIWYRDWLGKNMFIYRLLMLPTSRSNIYLAKVSVILVMVWGLVAFQLLILPLENLAFNGLVPSNLREVTTGVGLIVLHSILRIFIPQSFIEFVLYYGAGLMFVILVFTAVLIERSYRLKGVIGGILYFILAVFVFLLPVIISQKYFPNYLYPVELLGIEVVAGLFISCVSLWFSFFLLTKKITV